MSYVFPLSLRTKNTMVILRDCILKNIMCTFIYIRARICSRKGKKNLRREVTCKSQWVLAFEPKIEGTSLRRWTKESEEKKNRVVQIQARPNLKIAGVVGIFPSLRQPETQKRIFISVTCHSPIPKRQRRKIPKASEKITSNGISKIRCSSFGSLLLRELQFRNNKKK